MSMFCEETRCASAMPTWYSAPLEDQVPFEAWCRDYFLR